MQRFREMSTRFGLRNGERKDVVLRSSVVATLILLFLAYFMGTTPPTSPPPGDDAGGPVVEERGPAEEAADSKQSPRDAEGDASDVSARPVALPLAGKTIVIDAGHGGADPGALGVSGRTRESYNTLFVAKDVQKMLERAGARVVMTRTEDVFVSLEGRVAIANRSGADIFVSIHNDSNPDPSVRGVTTYYYTVQSRKLAETMQAALSTGLGARNVGVFQRPFVVVRGPWMPAVLVELGFLTNWTDERLLSEPEHRYKAALAIYNGIVNYFEAQ